MAFDIIGRNPTAKCGEYFRNNIAAWEALASYLDNIAPHITQLSECWHANEGKGLGDKNAKRLARALNDELTSGKTRIYARIHNDDYLSHNAKTFSEFLAHCGGFNVY